MRSYASWAGWEAEKWRGSGSSGVYENVGVRMCVYGDVGTRCFRGYGPRARQVHCPGHAAAMQAGHGGVGTTRTAP